MASGEHLARLIALFEQADREISARVADLEERGVLFSYVEREQRRREVGAILASLRKQAMDGKEAPASALIRESYQEGSRAALENMKAEGIGDGATLKRGMGGPHARSAEVLYANLAGSFEDGIAYVGRRTDDAFRRTTLEETLRANAASRTRRQTSTAIADRLRAQGIGAFRDKRGAVWSLKNYAEMSARTVSREAVTHGTLNRLAENGVDLVKVHVSAGACAKCQRHSQKIYSMFGGHPRYPALAEVPPFHPRCTCVITAHIERNTRTAPPATAPTRAEIPDTPPATGPRPAGTPDPVLASSDPLAEDDPFAEDFYDEDDLPTPEDLEQEAYEKSLVADMERAERSRVHSAIMEQGGIRTRAELAEEYREIPLAYKRVDGMWGDELADHLALYHPEFGITSEADLLQFFANR